jgi:hypothetical protein
MCARVCVCVCVCRGLLSARAHMKESFKKCPRSSCLRLRCNLVSKYDHVINISVNKWAEAHSTLHWRLLLFVTGSIINRVGYNHLGYIQCILGIFGREITNYTAICGVYIRFWPTLIINHLKLNLTCRYYRVMTFSVDRRAEDAQHAALVSLYW